MYVDADDARHRLAALAELERHLSFRISRLSKLLDNQATRLLGESRLTLTGYRILLVLSIFRETTAADLSRLMVIDRAQVSRAVAELVREGFVSDRPDPTNRRKRLLRVAGKGGEELDKVRPGFRNRQVRLETLLTEGELRGLTAAIDRLSRQLARELNHPEAEPASRTEISGNTEASH